MFMEKKKKKDMRTDPNSYTMDLKNCDQFKSKIILTHPDLTMIRTQPYPIHCGILFWVNYNFRS